jgi:uncharacterized membrane protein
MMTLRETQPKGLRRFALPASLLLNLFLIALIGGHLLRRDAHEHSFSAAPLPLARALKAAEATLSPADAAAFAAVMRRESPNIADSVRQVAEARRAVGRQILATPFDAKATREAMVAWQASWNHFFEQISNPLVDALGQISPEGRQKLVDERRKARGERPRP